MTHSPEPEEMTIRTAQDLDRTIHERTRLAIVSALAATSRATFKELKGLLGLSDGNLSVHTRKLEEAGYVRCHKSFAARVPKTEYELTPAGRKALSAYIEHMESLIRAMREADQVDDRPPSEAETGSSPDSDMKGPGKPTSKTKRSAARIRLGRRANKKT